MLGTIAQMRKAKALKVRGENSATMRSYYKGVGTRTLYHPSPRVMAKDYTKVAMHSPDTRTFRGEKATQEDIKNWIENNLVCSFSHTGKEI